jgi:ABC-type uncharacterized transport system fused permease/ATPase subunit
MAPHQALLGVRRKWKAWALLLAILALNLGMVYINVRLNSWNRDMYNVLQSRDYPQFKSLLWQFSGLAFVFVAIAIYSVYLKQALQIRWRYWMSTRYLDQLAGASRPTASSRDRRAASPTTPTSASPRTCMR